MSRLTNLSFNPNSNFSDPFMNPFYNSSHQQPSLVLNNTPQYPTMNNYSNSNAISDRFSNHSGPRQIPNYPNPSPQQIRTYNGDCGAIGHNYSQFFENHASNHHNHVNTSMNTNLGPKIRAANSQPFAEYSIRPENVFGFNDQPRMMPNAMYHQSQPHNFGPPGMICGNTNAGLTFPGNLHKNHVDSNRLLVKNQSDTTTDMMRQGKPGPIKKVASSQSNRGSMQSIRTQDSNCEMRSLEQEKMNPKAEGFMEAVERYELNPISLLNEVSGKLKKKIEYKVSEGPGGRNKVFECVCLLDNNVIGVKKGSSKQNSKEEAAKAGIYTILAEEEKFVTESAAIILSIQKASEKAIKQDKADQMSQTSFESKTTIDSDSNSPTLQSHKPSINEVLEHDEVIVAQPVQNRQERNTNKSPLQELNNVARRYAVEPVWSFSGDAKGEGEFEIKLQFGDLIVQEKGKRKQEAKKDAAAKMLEKIREAQQQGKTIVSLQEKISQLEIIEEVPATKSDRSRRVFESSLKPGLLAKLQSSKQEFKAPIQEDNSQVEAYMDSLLDKYELNLLATENLQVFFKKIIDYTSMITSNPKQIMLDAKQHMADYVRECYLVPIGSFALGCVRNNKTTIDSMLTFHKVNGISDDELLELYRHSLETCYWLDQQSGTNTIHMDFQFNIKTNDQQKYVEVVEIGKTGGNFKLNIYMSDHVENLAIKNIFKMYNAFDQSIVELELFRRILSIVKIWRNNSGLKEIMPEIFDAVVFVVFKARKSDRISDNVQNCLAVLASENLTETIVEKFDGNYKHAFQAIISEKKSELTKKCGKSLSCICEGKFVEAQLF